MPTLPKLREDETTRAALAQWLARHQPQSENMAVSPLSRPQTAGGSNETLLATATWTEAGQPREREIVVRVAPTALQVFLDPKFAQQYRVLETLGQFTDIPVPSVLGFEADESVLGAPFWVMDRVHGAAPADFAPYNQHGFLVEATPAQRERLWLNAVETLAAIHRLPIESFAFLDEPERGENGLQQQLSYWQQSLAWASDPHGNETLEALVDWLTAKQPADPPPGLSWGDSRIGNILFRDWRCVAVLDWEMVSLAGPLVDLGWWLLLDDALAGDIGLTRLAGLGTRADTIAVWEEHTSLKAQDLEWYEAFAGLRLGVILLRSVTMRRAANVPVPAPGEFGCLEDLTSKLARRLGLPEPA
jgi:aminoglycoside phosphotransferase (APT) family kinase protein